MNTRPTELPIHIYMFESPRILINVKAHDLLEAIDHLKFVFGEHWVRFNIDQFKIYNTNQE